MWWITAATILSVLLSVLVLSTQTTPVHACSPGPDFDPVAEADVIVGGRFQGYEVLEEQVIGEGNNDKGTIDYRGFSTVRVEMAVETVYKGALGGSTILLVDSSSLLFFEHEPEPQWAGSSGACGAFSSDPTGQYAIVGLRRNDDGTYGPSLPLNFFIGAEPAGANYEWALERMASFPAAAGLPALGTGPAPSTTTHHLIAGVAAAGVALLAASFAIRYGTATKT